MAKEYRGILLIMLALFRSTKGREIINSYREFKLETSKDDWILLIELLLEWEAHLNEPRMEVYHLRRLQKKHRYLMYLMRKIAKRSAGMGLKLLKFHLILHLSEDILQFGVPLEFTQQPMKVITRRRKRQHVLPNEMPQASSFRLQLV